MMIVHFDMPINGRRSTGTFELDDDRMTRSQVADDIISGQFAGVDEIYECTVGGSCRDITEEVAEMVRDRIVNDQHELRRDVVNWLHDILGCQSMPWPVAAE